MNCRPAVTRNALVALAGLAASASAQCPPGSITNLTASDGTQCNGVALNWSDVSGAPSYEVRRGPTSNFGLSVHIGTATSSQFLDPTPLAGVTHWYWVRAFRAACPFNNYGPYSSNSGWRGFVPLAPESLEASDGGVCNGVFVEWDAVTAANNYQVFRNLINQFATSVLVATTSGTSVTDLTALPGESYHYWAVASAPCGYSDPSDPDTGYRGASPPTPTSFAAEEVNCMPVGIRLTWDALPNTPLTQILRNTSSNYATAAVVGSSPANSWVDPTVEPHTEYYYWARSTALCGTSSAVGPVTATAADQPPRPANLDVVQGPLCETALITWDAGSGQSGLVAYQVLRATQDQFSAAQTINTSTLIATSYIDDTIEPNINYHYWVVAVNGCGPSQPTDPHAVFSVPEDVAFTMQPAPQAASIGGAATFSVEVEHGAGTLAYQWQRGGQPLQNGGSISGATTATLHIQPVTAGDAGNYRVVVTDLCGSATSQSATLTISCYANCDQSTASPVLTANDFQCFLNQFAAGESYANCDGSTRAPTLTANDFQCFLNAYAAGCQ